MTESTPLHQPLLITGAHRTGTTWVGKMLAADPHTAYISEPMNVNHRPGILRARIRFWYTYICKENEADYLSAFQGLLRYRYHVLDEIGSLRSGRDLLRMGRDAGIFLRGRLQRQRPLLKDPFAVFSLPWFREALNCSIVVTVRHPAGFASSLKRLDWPFDFSDLLNQPLLMRDHLEPYRSRMQSVDKNDLLGQAGLLWTMVYQVVNQICSENRSIQVVRHEDLSLDPIGGYRRLYDSLGLEFTPQVEQDIQNSSGSENPAELSRKKVHSVKLDSRANLYNWKRRLTSEEISRLRQITEEVSIKYYTEQEWH